MDFVGFIRVVVDFVRLFFLIFIVFDLDRFLIVVFKFINCWGEVIFKDLIVIMWVFKELSGLNGSGFWDRLIVVLFLIIMFLNLLLYLNFLILIGDLLFIVFFSGVILLGEK